MSERKNRIGMFDLAKGLLITFIILGHTLNLFFKYWESEDVSIPVYGLLAILKFFFYGSIPVFFFIFGYSFREKKVKACIAEQCKYVLVKYLFIAIVVIIGLVLKDLLKNKDAITTAKSYIVSFVFGICPGEAEFKGIFIHSIGPAWFLLAMALGSIILNFLFKLEEWLRIILLMTMVAFATSMEWHYFIPYCIVQTMVCMAYMYCGFWIKKSKWLLRKIKVTEVIVLVAIALFTVPRGNIEVSQNVWQLGMLDFVGSISVGLLLIKLFMFLDEFKAGFMKIFRKIGANSFDIFMFHSIEYIVVPWDKISSRITGSSVLGYIIVLVARVFVIVISCWIIKQIRKLLWKKKIWNVQK